MKRLFYFFLLLFSVNLLGQQNLTTNTFKYDSTQVQKATIEDIKWLEGKWMGSGFGGEIVEIWTRPSADQMIATFSLVEKGKPVFYEFCMIAEEKGSLIYKVKHFNPDLTGWEEKNDFVIFPLVKVEPYSIYFQGLTMKKSGKTVHLFLAMRQKDGSYKEEKLVYHKNKK